MFGKKDVEGLPYERENPLQLRVDSREESIVSLSPKTRICSWRADYLHSYFLENCAQPGLSWWPLQGSEASTRQVGP